MTLRVGIDATAANTPPLSGVGYHIVRLLESLEAAAPPDMEFRVFYAAKDGMARTRARHDLPASRRMRHVAVPFLRGFRAADETHWRFIFPLAIRHQRCHVFHGPAHILPRLRRVPSVVTIHDLAFFENDLYATSFTSALRDAVGRSIARATAIIAVSEHTRREIARLTGRRTDVHTIHNARNSVDTGHATTQPSDAGTLVNLGIRRRYVLYVGDFNPRKNVGYLIEGYAALRAMPSFGDVQLVLAGNSADAILELRSCAALHGFTGDDMVVPGRVSEEVLAALYRHASAVALCPIMEGFSIVTVEAMGYGVPVVATDVGPLREIAGQAAELVPLGEPQSVARALATALTTGPRRDEMRRLGLERARQFTWDAAATQTVAVYRSVAEAHAPRPSRGA